MIQFIKDSLRPARRLMTNKAYRELNLKLDGLRTKRRYQPLTNVKYLGFSFDVPDCASAYYSFKEIFSDEIYTFAADSNKKDPLIIDCGANIGASVVFFKDLYPQSKVIAIEADPMIFDYLTKNLERNGVKGVELINKAVWIDDDGVTFQSEGADGGNVNGKGALEIPSLRIKTLLSSLPHVDLLKMDVEGAETLILQDCVDELKKVDSLFVEYHSYSHEPQCLHQLLSVINRAGFRYDVQHLDPKHKPLMSFTRSKTMDLQLNIFCRQERLIR